MSRARDVLRCGCLCGCFFAIVGVGVLAVWLVPVLIFRRNP